MPLHSRQPATSLRVIPREQHAITRRNISQAALRVLYRLRDAGFEAYLVGGAVRDLLLGGHPKDFDVATNATPEEVRGLFRNSRLIGRRFRLAHVVFGSETIEVATFRGSEDDGSGDRHVVEGRLVRDNVYGTIEQDALRRDFRVNALYYDIADFSVRDYVGGMEDLERRVLHLIGDPEQRYREDPVRMLRAVRLAAKLGFTIDPAAAAPFAALGDLLGSAAPARLFDECLKLFLAGHAAASFVELERSGLLRHLFPATADALAHPGRGAGLRALILRGLENTDRRLAEDKSVTPAFLFALLLWAPVQARAEQTIAAGSDSSAAWLRAMQQVIAAQTDHVAIPRRFTIAMEDVWTLQPRFEQRVKKRVHRLLAHPRFRAAFDFLVLRGEVDPAARELAGWWQRAQQLEHAELVELLNATAAGATAAAAPAKEAAPARKRRRRRRKPGGGSSSGGGADAPESS